MCSALPLCKFWSGHGCEWQPNFVTHSPPFQICPWMLSGDLPPQQPGFIQLSRNGQLFFFLGPSKSSFLCAFSLHKDLHICVCQRGVLTSSAGRALFVYFFFLFFSSRNHFLPKKRDFLWPWLWHLSGLQRYRGKDKGISVLP